MNRCTSITTSDRKCKRNCVTGTDFCKQHNPLNKLNDDTCSICLDTIKDPMKLNCPHVFCKDCISNSIIKTSINCPCCRNQISMNDVEMAIKIVCGDKAARTYKLQIDVNLFPSKWARPSCTWTRAMKRLVLSLD